MTNKFLLMILDGWGIGNKSKSDVIFNAQTPNIDRLKQKYPNSQLLTSGENVGLPEGQMGNSEVGHMNIGAGRVVYQDLVKINIDIRNNNQKNNPEIINAFTYAKENNKNVHFIGLVSDGGVHSMDYHLYHLCDITKEYGLKNVFIHALTDGRDTDPRSGLGFITNLENYLKKSNGQIASLVGRYYTMDRDKRWERIKVGYDLLVKGIGEPSTDIIETLKKSYQNEITDEFIKPIVKVDNCGNPVGKVKEGDVFFCFNFRTDRLREITTVLCQKNMPEFDMKIIPLYYVTLTKYDESYKNVHIVYDKENIDETLGEVVSKAGKKQIRIAETEKYAHVTFFLSGGREEVFENEKRILIPSPKVATYDLKPEMSALEVKNAIIPEIQKQESDLICLNFANGDMVGHTGIYDAIIKAVETVDKCVNEIVEQAIKNNYQVMIIADHGNADYALNDDNSPNTAHSLNPVPCILISDKYSNISDGILADIAPTILKIMCLDIPSKMTGRTLV